MRLISIIGVVVYLIIPDVFIVYEVPKSKLKQIKKKKQEYFVCLFIHNIKVHSNIILQDVSAQTLKKVICYVKKEKKNVLQMEVNLYYSASKKLFTKNLQFCFHLIS